MFKERCHLCKIVELHRPPAEIWVKRKYENNWNDKDYWCFIFTVTGNNKKAFFIDKIFSLFYKIRGA